MAKKSPRTFLCIGGPLSGMALALEDIDKYGYVQYNRAGVHVPIGSQPPYQPSAVLIHKTFLGDILEITSKEVA